MYTSQKQHLPFTSKMLLKLCNNKFYQAQARKASFNKMGESAFRGLDYIINIRGVFSNPVRSIWL